MTEIKSRETGNRKNIIQTETEIEISGLNTGDYIRDSFVTPRNPILLSDLEKFAISEFHNRFDGKVINIKLNPGSLQIKYENPKKETMRVKCTYLVFLSA
jgi:hypothetical protein